MRLMSIVTASVMIGTTTGLSPTRASAQDYAAGSSTPTGTFTWTYESGSNRKSSLAYPNGATASWSYNNRGELTSVENRHADGTAISSYDYTYDAAGRRISKNDERYGYNARSELTQATSISDPNFHAAYQFDDIGNRVASAEFGIRSGEYTYTANELNQYASIVDENSSNSAAPSDATFTPTYDADGNQTLVKTKTGIWQVEYNAENRPVKWTCGATSLVMAFDRMGRRVLCEVRVNDTPIKTETFVYDGYTCILRQTTIHTNATPTVVRDTFIWDPTESVATRPLVWNRVEEKGSSRETHPTAFYFHDGNKNVSDVVSATDEIKAHYTYAPFGDCTATGALAQVNPWRFSSEYTDDELACVYYNYRHYEPTTGRWLSRDPMEDIVGNLYLLSLNNPFIVDVIGMFPFDEYFDPLIVGSISKTFPLIPLGPGRLMVTISGSVSAFDCCTDKGEKQEWVSGDAEFELYWEAGLSVGPDSINVHKARKALAPDKTKNQRRKNLKVPHPCKPIMINIANYNAALKECQKHGPDFNSGGGWQSCPDKKWALDGGFFVRVSVGLGFGAVMDIRFSASDFKEKTFGQAFQNSSVTTTIVTGFSVDIGGYVSITWNMLKL